MYRKVYLIECFKKKPKWNLDMMYNKVVELEKLYLITNDNFKMY